MNASNTKKRKQPPCNGSFQITKRQTYDAKEAVLIKIADGGEIADVFRICSSGLLMAPTRVESVENPDLMRMFYAERLRVRKLAAQRKEKCTIRPIITFHGTRSEKDVEQILEAGFDLARVGTRFGQHGGFGIYVSTNPRVALSYNGFHNNKLLACLTWVSYPVGQDPRILLVRNPSAILPRYVVHF